MAKPEDWDMQIARLELNETEVEIIASEILVQVNICDETIKTTLSFYPDEAERVAQGMLKAVEHIRTRKG